MRTTLRENVLKAQRSVRSLVGIKNTREDLYTLVADLRASRKDNFDDMDIVIVNLDDAIAKNQNVLLNAEQAIDDDNRLYPFEVC